ncbi:MAG: serpin family protein [Chloroflexi bacterium HGW-Chloroflexi-8]|nr:MAG: serpin family protein [Chloroflexi bacterium HGW-Chloroflexi-8]
MKKKIIIIIILVVIMSVSACVPNSAPTLEPGKTIDPTLPGVKPTAFPSPPSEGVQSISSSKVRQPIESNPAEFSAIASQMNAFGMDLYQQLSEQQSGNLFFSPYSISLALSMTLTGAQGQTEKEMANVLHYDLPQNSIHPQINGLDQSLYVVPEWLKDQETSFQLNVANALWGQSDYPFKTSFLDKLAEYYGAGMNLEDFKTSSEQARQSINDWVAQQTEDKIKDLIPQGALNEMTRLVLTNAIYFNANWQEEFNKDLTASEDFVVDETTTVPAEMMQLEHRFGYLKNEDVQMVEIPYLNSRYSMVLAMPISSDLSLFAQNLSLEQLSQSIGEFKNGQIILKMPKFKFETSFSVSSTLQALGMITPFSPESADFSGMFEPGADPLFISNVIHKAFVAVDEKGTEAAAATAVIMEATSAQIEEEPVLLTFNHPFLFLIRDNESGLILFMGNMTNPES